MKILRNFIILAILLACMFSFMGTAWAEDWSGSVSGKTYTSNTTVYVKGDVTLNGQILVNHGVTLTIIANGNYTIKRGTFNGYFFHPGSYNGSYDNTAGHISIDGGNYTLTFDGGAVYNTPNVATSGLKNNTAPSNYGRFLWCNGNVTMKNVIVQNFYEEADLFFQLRNQSNTDYTCKLTNCTFRGFYGGCLFYVYGPDKHDVTLKGVTFCDNDLTKNDGDDFGSCIRANGNTRSAVKLVNCKILRNKVEFGTIHWNTSKESTTHFYIYGPQSEIGNNTSVNTAGAIFNCGRMTISSANIHDNSAVTDAGAIRAAGYTSGAISGEGCSLILSDSVKICKNSAGNAGGAIFMEINANESIGFNSSHEAVTAYFKLQVEGEISGNHAPVGGAVYIGDFAPKKVYKSGWGNNGWSGEYVRNINIMPGAKIYGNYTDAGTHTEEAYNQYGGAIYIRKYYHSGSSGLYNGTTDFGTLTVSISGGDIYQNTANKGTGTADYTGCGGAFFLQNDFGSGYTSNMDVSVSGSAQLFGNKADNYGASIYLDRGTFTMTGGTIGKSGQTLVPGSSPAQYKDNKNIAKDGAGFYIIGGSCSVKGGTISYNEASRYGGGFYVNPGSGSNTLINSEIATTTINNNKAPNGAGVYVASGSLAIRNEHASRVTTLKANEASDSGGAIYMNSGDCTIEGGILQYNHATSDGGAIYANGGTVTVNYPSEAAGTIQYNSAAEKGGALFISSTGRLNLYGNTTLKGNHVPFGKYGGGVYLEGIVQAGNGDSHVIKVAENYADEEGSTITDANRNNIYLPNPTVNNDHKDVITVVNDGLDLSSSSIGFSVPDNYVPVIYCSTTSYLYPTLMESNAVFEDSHSYQKFYSTSSPYDENYIYLAADTWVDARKTMPEGFNISSIDSADDLAWLISTVNGLNGQTATNYSGQVVKLTADIDMRAHSWVPIGINGHEFQGTFDGGGHTITGIHCTYIKGSAGTGTQLGLFGTVNNAAIHDVFIDDSQILVRDQTSGTYSMGTIANEAKGSTTIYNCSSNAYLEAILPTTTMGGLVGSLAGSSSIHSSWSTAQMKGGAMGGIVGTMASGTSLKNSFANVKFTYEGSTQYVGGLVSTNTGGTVENCYVREQDGSNAGSNFGWVVGNNSSGTITYCYIPDEETNYKAAGTAQANNCTTYGETATPYLYLHEDNQMAANSYNTNIVNGALDRNGLKGLLATLNKWVGSSATYAKWMRTSASPINGDYPVFKYTNYECLASTDNIGLEYAASFNKKFDDYVRAKGGAGIGTIYLYQTPAVINAASDAQANVNVSNYGKATKLYIHEDVALKPASVSGSKATDDIEAYVGITLDNSAGTNGANPSFGGSDAIDWHFFSSALKNSQIGLHYGVPGETEDTEPYEAYVYPSWHATFTNANGYFPTNLNDVVGGDDYYEHWDLYGYYEPDYHWVNYKRNSASHWHEDWPGINIPYTNDTEFVPGKGYLVALKEEGYLQAYGTLNTNTGSGSDFIEVPLSYTSDISWTTRQGHNLLGNPYQSYLDFDLFADYNKGLWGNDKTKAYYIIIDEYQKSYVKYAYGSSENPFGAGRYLHPHQGFMIIVSDSDMSAKFDNRMRNTTAAGVGFRDNDRPNYPLVNLMATDRNGNRDLVTVELGRPDKGGAPKQQALRTSSCSLWCRYEDEDYALVFTQPGLEYANIRFAADEDAEFTMTWSTHNGEFSYLHLIDNMTGADIDCLSTSEYKFSARESDYNSRFRLVFDYTGIDDHEVPEPVEGPATFAYYANGEIHLTDADDDASLQIIDMTGRVIVSRDGVHTVSTTGLAAGVYVLRLTTANGTRTQKIILN